MQHTKSHNLMEQFINACDRIPRDRDFQRSVNGESEEVEYLPETNIRFWLNDLYCEYREHWHPAMELIVPLENTYTVKTSTETYLLQPGDIFIIPGGTLHHLIAPPTGKRLIFLFDFNVLSKIQGHSFVSSYLAQPVLINKENGRMIYDDQIALLCSMVNLYVSGDSLIDMSIYAQILNFFVNYAHHRISKESQLSDGVSSFEIRQQEVIDKFSIVFDFLDEHYMEDITLEDVANVAGFSKFYFSRLFKQYQNCNFYDYLCYIRIKAAERLLMERTASITEVALQSGFSSLSTFNRTFKKIRGCTPSEYRNLYRSANKHPERV